MRTARLNYDLPRELVAQKPARLRDQSRLLVLDRLGGKIVDSRFDRLREFLSTGDCLVLNNTKVLPARFFAQRPTGGRLEGLFLAEPEPGIWQVMLKGARKVRKGERIKFLNGKDGEFCTAEILDKSDEGRCLLGLSARLRAGAILEKIGLAPLPPYIRRSHDARLDAIDRTRYQTVYARQAGAVAAPTAGLHFTAPLIEQLKRRGIRFAFVTLHVGLGTFKPVTAESLEEHSMEAEPFGIDEQNAAIINAAKADDGRVIAVGTTSVRVLETVAEGSCIKPCSGETGLFIKPGYEFRLVDAMVTNFHLPCSTLLALVAAFAGLEQILGAYRHAVEQRYRFYSYGDAMLVL